MIGWTNIFLKHLKWKMYVKTVDSLKIVRELRQFSSTLKKKSRVTIF